MRLQAAVRGNDSNAIGQLIKDGEDINGKDNNGRTALSWAAEKGNEWAVEMLLRKDGIDVNSKDNNGRTALLWAIAKGNQRAIEMLLKKDNIDVNSADKNGRTALSWAAEKGNKWVVGQLLKNDRANLNCTDNNGRTPLWCALEKGHVTMVNLFARKDITTLRIAIAHKRHDLITLLLDRSAKIKDIMAENWRDAYVQQASDTLLLSEEKGQLKSVHRIEEREIRHELAGWSAKRGTRRLLLCVMLPLLSHEEAQLVCQASFRISRHGSSKTFLVGMRPFGCVAVKCSIHGKTSMVPAVAPVLLSGFLPEKAQGENTGVNPP
jgi:ankyrin repeat protein